MLFTLGAEATAAMSEDNRLATALIYTLLGSGGVTFIWTLVKSILAYRASAESREDRAVARLEQFEEECRKDLAHERKVCAYWCAWAGTLEYEMKRAGLQMPPKPTPPRRPTEE